MAVYVFQDIMESLAVRRQRRSATSTTMIGKGLVQTLDTELETLCRKAGKTASIQLQFERSIAEFLVALHDRGFDLAVLDFEKPATEQTAWVKLIRRLRPKLPLIVVCDQIDHVLGARLHELGIFYLGCRPLHQRIMHEVFTAALKISSESLSVIL